MTVEPIPKWLLRLITTGPNPAMNQSEFPVITCNLVKAREKSRAQLRCSWFWFYFSLGEKLARDFYPITKLNNRNSVDTLTVIWKLLLSTDINICNVTVDFDCCNHSIFHGCYLGHEKIWPALHPPEFLRKKIPNINNFVIACISEREDGGV